MVRAIIAAPLSSVDKGSRPPYSEHYIIYTCIEKQKIIHIRNRWGGYSYFNYLYLGIVVYYSLAIMKHLLLSEARRGIGMSLMECRTSRIILFSFLGAYLIFSPCGQLKAGERQESGDRTFERGRINTTDGFRIDFASATLTGTELTYFQGGSKTPEMIPAERILRIELVEGSHAFEFGLVMGISGLLGSLLGIKQGEEMANDLDGGLDESKKMGIILACTGVSLLIGLAIGASYKKYGVAYTNPQFDTEHSRFSPGFTMMGETVYLCVQRSF
jgi:hypothetical protein